MLWSPCVKSGDDHELFMIAAAQHKVITGKKQKQNRELFCHRILPKINFEGTMDILMAKSRDLEKPRLNHGIQGFSEKEMEPNQAGTTGDGVSPLRNWEAGIAEDVKGVVVDKNSPIQELKKTNLGTIEKERGTMRTCRIL